MQRIPEKKVPPRHEQFEDLEEPPHSQIMEQVPGTRTVPASVVLPRRIDPGRGSIPEPTRRDIPKRRLRRAHTLFGLIIATLFAFYLVWTFVQAGRDVVNEQETPAQVTPPV